jgi:glycosyltransferase involved in cell wall biosynthesis
MLHVVHDGVEPAFADSGDAGAGRHSLKLRDDQTLLLTVAKLTDHKGHAFLLRAIPDLIRQFPNLIFAFAGDGELRDRLVALADELRISSHVRFLGYRHDVPDLLAAADMVVQPSHLEGLCSSLIDAMLARKAIVATRAGGIPDLLQRQAAEKPLAWLAEPKSPDSLTRSISTALRCTDERRLRGERARRRALQHFTANAMVEKTLNVYELIRQAKPHAQAASPSRSPAWSTV